MYLLSVPSLKLPPKNIFSRHLTSLHYLPYILSHLQIISPLFPLHFWTSLAKVNKSALKLPNLMVNLPPEVIKHCWSIFFSKTLLPQILYSKIGFKGYPLSPLNFLKIPHNNKSPTRTRTCALRPMIRLCTAQIQSLCSENQHSGELLVLNSQLSPARKRQNLLECLTGAFMTWPLLSARPLRLRGLPQTLSSSQARPFAATVILAAFLAYRSASWATKISSRSL